jgi:hypothetical protein
VGANAFNAIATCANSGFDFHAVAPDWLSAICTSPISQRACHIRRILSAPQHQSITFCFIAQFYWRKTSVEMHCHARVTFVTGVGFSVWPNPPLALGIPPNSATNATLAKLVTSAP